ncbi:hypothetical protein DOTSEDRAFT_56874 [Dothistroma septosporum NZE10]|uniref:Manganese/iron superoxide dismutase C-terminal domain-containing protein n=1 Tax=Dothistroma septosporum (strain NZE10 / CBS 128990) TaxID=675120 RepID=M2YKX7_DOTSN|nr:hypothetical protein DOTSEDRAFT_56874 [Dothistroma septosporum NZE10]
MKPKKWVGEKARRRTVDAKQAFLSAAHVVPNRGSLESPRSQCTSLWMMSTRNYRAYTSTTMITRRLARPLASLASSQWTCPSCRTSIIRQTQRPSQIRSLHRVPLIAYHEAFSEKGVDNLFSRQGYEIAWDQYQTHLVQKINELTAGEPIENTPVKDIAIQFARDPMNASLFNYASAAHNNQHFFSTLAPAPLKLGDCPQLQESLVKTFGSIETLRMTMLDTAAAMFGPGFVWLVWARNVDGTRGFNGRGGSWRILTTYLAGTPYPEAGYRAQGLDMATNNQSSYNAYLQGMPANTAGSFGAFSQSGKEQAKIPPGGTSVMPVLSVSTWEHTYIYDYGITGKRNYLDKWWNAVDWGVVEQNAPMEAKQIGIGFQRQR